MGRTFDNDVMNHNEKEDEMLVFDERPDSYKQGWNAGYDTGVYVHDILEDEEPGANAPPDPSTLNDDERVIYDLGYGDGYDSGYDDGYDTGYSNGDEDAKEQEHTHQKPDLDDTRYIDESDDWDGSPEVTD